MPRRTLALLITLTLAILGAPLAAGVPQPPTTVHRIGLLSSRSPPAARPYVEAFRQGVRALGYVEGQHLALEERYAEGRAERLPELAAELVRLPVEVIVAGGAEAIRAAQQATRTIPIVMAGTADPVAAGFVASLARPGGNITGVSDWKGKSTVTCSDLIMCVRRALWEQWCFHTPAQVQECSTLSPS
jgi:ABC-type uncharacterized transport system substrate-binding protein